MTLDVRPVGQNGTNIGFATFNTGFHALTGANMTLYTITDWLGLVPVFICMIFGGVEDYHNLKEEQQKAVFA